MNTEKENNFSQDAVDSGNQQPGVGEVLTFEEVVTPAHLQMITESAGGFRFIADPNLPPTQTGYTNKETKEIFYNPLLLSGSPEHGIKPWTREDIHGFTYHEAGHHAKAVLDFDEKLIKDLGNPDIIPEVYRGDPQSETRFFSALYRHLDNGIVDVWNESYIGRRPFYPINEDIKNFQSGKGDIEDFRSMPKPQQLMQAVLRSRYFAQKNIKSGLDPDVYQAYEKIKTTGALKALTNASDFENPFGTPASKERSIDRKFSSYKEVFLPEYLKLMEAEVEKRKEKKEKEKAEKQSGNQGGQPQPGGDQGEGQKGENQPSGEQGQSQPGQEKRSGQGGSSQQSESVPLTKGEEKELTEQILSELEEAGKEFQSLAPSEEEKEKRENKMKQIQQQLEERQKELESGETPKPQPSDEEGPKGEEALRELNRQLEREYRESQRRGLSESMGVKQESIRKWEQTKEKCRIEINSLATALSEIFLDDRRKRMEYLKREGEIVPGLEYETITALLSGELDPDTKMRTITNPEFLETEMEFIVDGSSSMSGNKIEKSIELMVIITEALRQAKDDLSSENLLADDEQPFRVGVTKFTTQPKRVTKLSAPLDDKKELQIIDKVSEIGGGTDEVEAISSVYKELTINKKNVIKIMIVLSDGEGNQDGVRPIIRQIEDDKEVVFLAVGLGDDQDSSNAIVDTYLSPLQNREGNVYGLAAADPNLALPSILEFLKREVEKHRQS